MKQYTFITVGFFLFTGILFPVCSLDAKGEGISFGSSQKNVALPAFGGNVSAGAPATLAVSYPPKKLNPSRKPLACTSADALFAAYEKFARNDDFEGMYLLMTPEFRQSYDFSKFCHFMEEDLDISGGLIKISRIKFLNEQGRYSRWQATLHYKNKKMPPRTVIVTLKTVKKKWLIHTGVMMPIQSQKFR